MDNFWVVCLIAGIVSLVVSTIVCLSIDAYYQRRADEEVGEYERRE